MHLCWTSLTDHLQFSVAGVVETGLGGGGSAWLSEVDGEVGESSLGPTERSCMEPVADSTAWLCSEKHKWPTVNMMPCNTAQWKDDLT